MMQKLHKFSFTLLSAIISISLLSVLVLSWPKSASAATPADEDFQSYSADWDGTSTASTAPSIPRTLGDWTYSILDASGNNEITASTNAPFVEISTNQSSADGYALPVGSNKALYLAGYYGTDSAAKISSNTGPFKLVSFEAETGLANPAFRVVGYLNGSPVSGASYDFTAPAGSTTTVDLTNQSDWGNIDEFRIVQQDGSNDIDLFIDSITVADPVLPNTAPTFVGSTSALTVNQNASATDIKNLLHVSDTDSGQTETWTQSTAPSHGTLNISGVTAASGSTDIAPGGTITYTPTTGYSGTDSLAVQVSDGNGGTATRTITVTVLAQAAATTASPADGSTVASGSTVTLSTTTSGATIYYTTDGSTPTTSSSSGGSGTSSASLTVSGSPNATVTVKAIAVKSGMSDSAASTFTYTIQDQAVTPTANPSGGAVASGSTVTLSTSTSGATIYYTIDGSTPSSSSTTYSAPISVTGAMTIKAIAIRTGMSDSAVMRESYTTMSQVATPTATPAGGAVASGTEISLSTTTTGATIYYTTDGSVPTVSSAVYSAPILVTGTTIVKAIAVKAGMTNSAVMTQNFTLYMPGTPVIISVDAGNGHAIVMWSPVAEAQKYLVYESAVSGTYGSALNTVRASVYKYDFTNLSNGTPYYFIVKALNGSVESPASNEVSAIPQVPSPEAPELQAPVAGNAQVTLSWKPVDGSTGYKIFSSTTSKSYGAEVATVSGSVYSYDVTNLVNGTTYYFVVKAMNPGGESAGSNEVSATPMTVPAAPIGITATAGDGQTTVSFTPPSDNGGSTIKEYIVTSNPDGIAVHGSGSPIIVTGLSNGTNYTFTVVAVNGVGSSAPSTASNAVTPQAPSSGHSDTTPTQTTSNATPPPADNVVNVLVNGKVEQAGTASTSNVNGQSVTRITVDQHKLDAKLAAEGNNVVVTIPVNAKSDVIVGELNGQMVKNMEKKQAVVEIKTDDASYTLPAQQINVTAISDQFGHNVALQDIKIQIEISKPTSDKVQLVESAAKNGEFSIVAPPLEFTVTGSYGDQKVEVSKFNAYVERTIAIPDGVDPSKITTGIVVDPDGTVRHVPTKIVVIDGKYYALMNSLTNSMYSVVWHPLQFKDVAHHWAKDAVNDMGSRMIIDGMSDGSFQPDRDMTRAEFAATLVRALGLKSSNRASPFRDVNKTDWYSGYIATAYQYGIVSGYEDGSFAPTDTISREQAMAMIANAMHISGLVTGLQPGEADKLLAAYSDSDQSSAWARSDIAACVKTGVVSGRNGNLIAPVEHITRAEVAEMVRKLLIQSDLINETL